MQSDAKSFATLGYLERNNIPYTEIDVLEDGKALDELRNFGYIAVPVVSIDTLDYSWEGYRPDLLAKLGDIIGKN